MRNISFNKFYKKFNIISLTLIFISIILLTFKGLNFGVDFKGGTLIELSTLDNQTTINVLRQSFLKMNIGDVSVKQFGKDKDYLVQGGKVLIVDEFTGRAMEGRRFSEGLHQAIEAKENLDVQVENQTLASITYQN